MQQQQSVTSLILPSSVSLKRIVANKVKAAWGYLRIGPSHFLMYTLGRLNTVRSIVRLLHRDRTERVGAESTVSVIEEVIVKEAASAIRRDGYFPGLRLRQELLEPLRWFFTNSTCFADENLQLPLIPSQRLKAEERYGKIIRMGCFEDPLNTCAPVRALASDPKLLAIAREYMGCEPVLLGARVWWSFATAASESHLAGLGQGFHYDLDGYSALAFFFYLTDVDESTGPHICARESHTNKPLRSLLSLYRGKTDTDIEKWYGKHRQVVLCGTAGYGFAEDIFCFHKGLHPDRADRLILQLRYGMRSYSSAHGTKDG
jgi:hypothetical protein